MTIKILLSPDLEQRFWSKVDKGAPDECWPWTRSTRKGYGTITLSPRDCEDARRRSVFTHRLSYYMAQGEWPEPLGRHTCDNPICCNPRHVISGTPKQNMGDKYERGRAVHPRGERSVLAVLTASQAAEIRSKYATGMVSQRALAAEYGIAQPTVCRVVRGERYL